MIEMFDYIQIYEKYSELGIIENKTQETNKILNKFYKGDKNLSPEEEKIIKKLKN